MCLKSSHGKATAILEKNYRLLVCSLIMQCLHSVRATTVTGLHLVVHVTDIKLFLAKCGRRYIERGEALNLIESVRSSVCDNLIK